MWEEYRACDLFSAQSFSGDSFVAPLCLPSVPSARVLGDCSNCRSSLGPAAAFFDKSETLTGAASAIVFVVGGRHD
jgi:hypothetical protein